MITNRSSWSKKTITAFAIPIAALFTFAFIQCTSKIEDYEEVLNLTELLPEGAISELAQGHPDLKVSLVTEKNANVNAKYGEKHIRVDGIEDDQIRERIAIYILQYIENPNKKEEDKAKREVYNNLPPKEKMDRFIERMKVNYPDFEYEWVGAGEGNVKVEYGDNSLVIKGVEDDGSKEEIAHGIIRIQKDIDQLSTGEQE